jgi:hypothetical protein
MGIRKEGKEETGEKEEKVEGEKKGRWKEGKEERGEGGKRGRRKEIEIGIKEHQAEERN